MGIKNLFSSIGINHYIDDYELFVIEIHEFIALNRFHYPEKYDEKYKETFNMCLKKEKVSPTVLENKIRHVYSGILPIHSTDNYICRVILIIDSFIDIQFPKFVRECIESYIGALSEDTLYKSNLLMTKTNNMIRGIWSNYVNTICHDKYNYDYNYLFELLSRQKYENGENNSKLVLCFDRPKLLVKLENSIDLNIVDKRPRKLLEVSRSNLMMIIVERHIIGFTEFQLLNKPYVVIDYGHKESDWNITQVTDSVSYSVYVNDGIPLLCKDKLSINDSRRIFNEVFYDCEFTDLHEIIISTAISEKHGTMLVFLEDALLEAKRLKNVGFIVKVREIEKCMNNITTIDGAILLNKDGEVVSIGTILDGSANEMSLVNISRGARYNSAIKYSSSVKQRCLILVVSEDGYINFISEGKEVF